MSAANQLSEHEVEQIIGRLLQVGVLIAGVVTLVGGVLLLLSGARALAARRAVV